MISILNIRITADAIACLQMFDNGVNIRGQRVATTEKIEVAMQDATPRNGSRALAS
jgi:hypothetical protein